MAAGLGALGDDDVGAGGGVAGGVHRRARQRRHQHVLPVSPLHQVGRRRAEGGGDQPDRVGEGDVEERGDARRRHVHRLAGDVLVAGQHGYAEVVEQAVEEGPVLGRQPGGHAGGVEPSVVGADVLLREQEVDAERGAAALLPDPGQVVIELVGGVADGAQHPEPADTAHGRHDVTAVAERQDGELDPQLVLDPSAHGRSVAPEEPGLRTR